MILIVIWIIIFIESLSTKKTTNEINVSREKRKRKTHTWIVWICLSWLWTRATRCCCSAKFLPFLCTRLSRLFYFLYFAASLRFVSFQFKLERLQSMNEMSRASAAHTHTHTQNEKCCGYCAVCTFCCAHCVFGFFCLSTYYFGTLETRHILQRRKILAIIFLG